MPFTIAVDIDEVLGSFVAQLCLFHNENFGTRLTLGDFHSYRFWEVWGGTSDQASSKVQAFYQSRHFLHLPLIDGASDALSQLKNSGYDLVVVTSRQHAVQQQTLQWLDRHFAGVFREVYFGNHYAQEGRSISKAELCVLANAKCLVDDNLGYAVECAAAGLETLLFDYNGSYPWNKVRDATEDTLPPGVKRVRSWRDVVCAVAQLQAETGAEAL